MALVTAPSFNINSVLGGPNLTGLIEYVPSGLINLLGDEYFMKSADSNVYGDEGEYTTVVGQRGTSRLSAYGAPSRNAQLVPVGKKSVKLMHTIENINLPMLQFSNLLQYNSLQRQDKGKQYIATQVTNFKARFSNLRYAARMIQLSTGAISFDAEGNLLPPNASVPAAGTTISFGIPNGNANQAGYIQIPGVNLNNNGSTGTNIGRFIDPLATGIGVIGLDAGGALNSGGGSWANAATPIDQQIKNAVKAVFEYTGFILSHALYGSNVAHNMMVNNSLTNYWVRNQNINAEFSKMNAIPTDELLGIKWKDVSNAMYTDQNGAIQSLMPANTVIMHPDPSVCFGWLEGSYMVPKTIDIATDPSMEPDKFDEKFGMFAYGSRISDPPTAKIVMGDTMLPVITNPYPILIIQTA